MMQRLREAIRTRGFWTSQVLWFLAGAYFTRLIPAQQTEGPWLSDLLQRILIVLILIPIYFDAVLNVSKRTGQLIEFVLTFFRK